MKNKILLFLNRILNLFRKIGKAITPGRHALWGATIGLLIIACSIVLVSSFMYITSLGFFGVLALISFWLSLIVMISGLTVVVINLVHAIPNYYRWVLFGTAALIAFSFSVNGPGIIVIILVVVVFASLTGGGLWVLRKTTWKDLSKLNRILTSSCIFLGSAGLIAGTVWLVIDGFPVELPNNAALQSESKIQLLEMPDPSETGNYPILRLFYGSGKDRHRPEFGKEVNIKTDPVDGSPFIDNWKGFSGWARTKYWGFDAEALPLNASVWYPEGNGPFPLVLVVHGNHSAQDFSDPGYDYLGELLASRGFILASVDENFINGSWTDIFKGLKKENDARGWLLLKHLQLWRTWNEKKGNPFYYKIDLDNISLIGHSRGGEAVAIATCFNRLPLSNFSFLQPQIKVKIMKADFMTSIDKSENVFQNFEFPLINFVDANPDFDYSCLSMIRFIFDQTGEGVIILDNIGFR